MVRFNLPGGQDSIDIRTFEGGAPSDTFGVEPESPGGRTDVEDAATYNNVSVAIANRTIRGQTIITQNAENWRFEPPDASGNVMITSPTASKMPHFAVHGAFISGLRPSSDPGREMTDIANILGARNDFDAKLAEIASPTSWVLTTLHRLVSLPDDSSEDLVQNALMRVIMSVAVALRVIVFITTGERIAVGGILADNKYNIKGKTVLQTWMVRSSLSLK